MRDFRGRDVRGTLYAILVLAIVVSQAGGSVSLGKGRSSKLEIPDIWGQGGALFAFSGFDGNTDVEHPLVGSTLSSGRGFVFHTKAHPMLFAAGLDTTGAPLQTEWGEDAVLVGSDVTQLIVTFKNELWATVSFVFASANVVLAAVEAVHPIAGCAVGIRSEVAGSTSEHDGVLVQEAGGEWYACASKSKRPVRIVGDGVFAELRKFGDSATFAWAYSAKSRDDALTAAREALQADFDQVRRARLRFFSGLPKPPRSASSSFQQTYYKSASVMKVNSCSPQGDIPFPWTTPDRWPHENMWIWDSAFHAIGFRHFAPDWAENAIKAVLSKQRKNGFIPHMMSIDRARDSGVVQPPILSWAAWRVYQKTGNRGFLEYCYPRLKAMILFDCRELDKDNDGLSEWESGGASGMDNSPRFDKPLGDAIDFNSYICNDLEYLAKIAEELGKQGDTERWLQMRQERAAKINQLMWDGDSGFYYDLTPDGKQLKIKTAAGLTPLFAGICNPGQAKRLVTRLENPSEFWRTFPIATVSADEPTFCDNMWRGPVWVNYNYLIIEGLRRYGFDDLAAELKRKTLEQIAHWYETDGVIYEFYDSEGKTSPLILHRKGKGGPNASFRLENLGTTICDYHWTAAVFIDLLLGQAER